MKDIGGLYPAPVPAEIPSVRNAKLIATTGEKIAASFLQKNGYEILARNYRAGRRGEIDIVARSPEEQIIFVEVKTRTQEAPGITYGIPEIGFEAVDLRKQRKIKLVAQEFGAVESFSCRRWRYDVIVVLLPADDSRMSKEHVTHVENAFT